MAAKSGPVTWIGLGVALLLASSGRAWGQKEGNGSPSPSVSTPGHAAIVRVTSGSGILPNQHGQVWREYDISPYSVRVTATNRPEQAIVDWILRETGYEIWHSEPLGILNATPRTLRVYHTPQVQAVVAEIVDRFVNTETESYGFGLRMITVDGPSWRSKPQLQRLLAPVPVQTPGTQAWLLEKEGVALLLAELRRRSDFREHTSPNLLVANGQSTVIQAKQGRSYVRNLVPRPDVWPGYQPETGLVDEGFALELNPLLSLDGRMIDATLKCDIDQLEKLIPVMIDVPTPAAPRQQVKIEVPQMSHFRFHERFRWPTEQVILVSMGVIPAPVPGEGKSLVPGVPLPWAGPPRAELLILVECKGRGALSPRTLSAERQSSEAPRWSR